MNVTGGVREALFGDENYPIMWGKRQGFAKAAIQANVVRLVFEGFIDIIVSFVLIRD